MEQPGLLEWVITLSDLGISVMVTEVNKRVSRQESQSKTAECSRKGNKTDCWL